MKSTKNLTKLANEQNEIIRPQEANNPNPTNETLPKLATDTDDLRFRTANNSKTPNETLTQLTENKRMKQKPVTLSVDL